MKKVVLALVAAVAGFTGMSSAFAYDNHHHPVCHKVRVHHHWENRCH